MNQYPEVMTRHLVQAGVPAEWNIKWVSPISDDRMAEYRDEDFLKWLELTNRIVYPLNEFWPRKGPQWDGLGIAKGDTAILVEAKANIPEVVSPRTQAKGHSLQIIEKTMKEVRGYLNVNSFVDWIQTFYQYTNRLCHLYYLKEKNRISAYLVNVYFIGDKGVGGPQTEDDWRGAITVMKEYLGLNKRHKLSKYMIDVFIHMDEIGGHADG